MHSSVEEKASHFATAEFPDGSRLILDTERGREKDKHVLDRQWYRMLAEKAGRTLAWGTLLGVRPTKLAFQKREEGFDREEFLSWFRKEYLVSEDKAALAWDIDVYKRQERMRRMSDILPVCVQDFLYCRKSDLRTDCLLYTSCRRRAAF